MGGDPRESPLPLADACGVADGRGRREESHGIKKVQKAECASWVRDIGYSGYRPHWSDWFSLWGDGPLADVLLAWRD